MISINNAYGNFFVLAGDGHVMAMCSREQDAKEIKTALDLLHRPEKAEPPKVTPAQDSVKVEHPSYGVVSASSCSGTPARLFDCGADVSRYVTVRVSTAILYQGDHRDIVHQDNTLIEFEMSELQWAEFISMQESPCTFTHVTGACQKLPQGRIPRAVEPSLREAYTSKFKANMTRVTQGMDTLIARAADIRDKTGATKGEKAELVRIAGEIKSIIEHGIPLLQESFDQELRRAEFLTRTAR